MMSDDSKLKETQEEFLIALKYYHKFCVEHGVNYSMHGGTLLGTVREHGFIPWDDDIDTSMTRSEYEKFERAVKKAKLAKYFYYDDKSSRTPHLCMQRPGKPLVWISIFIYDYISEKKWQRNLKKHLIKIWMLILMQESNALSKKNSGLKDRLEYLIWKIGEPNKRAKRIQQFHAFCKNKLTGNKKFVHRSNDTNAWNGMRIVLPANVMDSYKILPFEDGEAMITTSYDEVLKTSYGKDYMTPKKDNSKAVLHEVLRENLGKNYGGK